VARENELMVGREHMEVCGVVVGVGRV